MSSKRSRNERLRSAAIVKMKYLQMTGRLDKGFKVVFDGVLEDLRLSEQEVDQYIENNREELSALCLEDR
ncbi:MAG: hypothetical protein JXR96_24075 [Deltaproteobacteria bacterium]|nr:hypothetical protein [Deltaproteobacteria bacterium]